MKFEPNLHEFNCRLVGVLRPTFPSDVKALQSADGTLQFRGPIRCIDGQAGIGTHVEVSLAKEVTVALSEASAAYRDAMMNNLICHLRTQVSAKYDPNKIGEHALNIVGTMLNITG